MADTALDKVLNALKASFEAWPGLAGIEVYVDRQEDETFAETEIEAINIRVTGVDYQEVFMNGQLLHTAQLSIDILTKNSGVVTINPRQREIAAHMIACIDNDRVLGGRLNDMRENGLSPSSLNGIDIGAASLDGEMTFFTTLGNHFVIIGQGGLIF